jgi:hypothetical protein
MNTHVIALALATCLAASEASANDLVPLEWAADGSFAKEVTVPATKFVEVCGKLSAQSAVAWEFNATAPLNFNIHYHAGEKVHFPARKDAVAQDRGQLSVKLDQDYCWMWTNKGPRPAGLKFNLKRR